MRETTESELVRRAQAGDKTAYEDLMRPLIGPAARLAFAMVHDRAEAEDIVQEAGLKAWRRLGNLRPGSAFRPWFLAVVANQSRKARSGRWWLVLKQADLQGGSQRNPDPGLAADVRRALLVLSPDERIVLIMHFYLDLPLNEVAETLGLKESGVKSRINRALKRLRPLLAEAVTP